MKQIFGMTVMSHRTG